MQYKFQKNLFKYYIFFIQWYNYKSTIQKNGDVLMSTNNKDEVDIKKTYGVEATLNKEMFLQKYPEFSPVNMKNLWERKLEQNYQFAETRWLKCSPLLTGTDGFFVCVLQKK